MQAQLISQDQRGAVAYYFSGATVADIDRYIDPAGSDVTGTGLAGAPYATVDRAKLDIPRRVEHMVHLHVAAGAYGAMSDWDSFSYGINGWISVDASAAMADVSGVLTVDAGGTVVIQDDGVIDIPIVGGGLGVDEYRDKYVEILTGADAGYLVPIIGNTATTLRAGPEAWELPEAADTVRVVEPAATFTSAGTWTVGGTGLKMPHLFFLGVQITTDRVEFEGTQASMVGSVLSVSGYGYFSRGSFYTGLDVPVTGIDNATWAASGEWLVGSIMNGGGTLTFTDMNYFYGVLLSELTSHIFGSNEMNTLAVRNESGNGLELLDGCVGQFWYLYAHAKNDSAAIMLDDGSQAMCYHLFANAGKYGVQLGAGASARLTDFEGAAANIVTAGILVGGGARVTSKTCTLVSTGAVAVAWGSGAAASAWPAANAVVNDARAALVVGAN